MVTHVGSPFCGYSRTWCAELNGENLLCYFNESESVTLRKCPHDHRLTNKAYSSDITVTNVSYSITYKMAAEINWHRYCTKLRHCHPCWLGSRVVSVLDSGAEGPGFKSQSRRCRVTGLRQTVHTHRASVHQAAKLVAVLLRVAEVTAGLAESNGSLPPGLWLTSLAGWLPRTGISSGTPCSVIYYGLPLPFLHPTYTVLRLNEYWRCNNSRSQCEADYFHGSGMAPVEQRSRWSLNKLARLKHYRLSSWSVCCKSCGAIGRKDSLVCRMLSGDLSTTQFVSDAVALSFQCQSSARSSKVLRLLLHRYMIQKHRQV